MTQQTTPFTQAVGRWAGNAEVFDGQGHFLGNGTDYRYVQMLDGRRLRVDVSFVGPFKHSGHYFIQQEADHRLYQGPANMGYAEALSDQLVDANAYWPALGLSQRFFLLIVDGNLQLSLAHMSRGEQVLYVVVGQNDRVPEDTPVPQPSLVSGVHYDWQNDPSAGRGEIILHRAGLWCGNLTALGENNQPLGTFPYSQQCQPAGAGALELHTQGGAFAGASQRALFVTNGWQAWAIGESEVVGSYSLSGGRALSGQFYYRTTNLRCWQREVTTLDGARKAVVQQWYRGGRRIGSQSGVLEFERA
ncbi:MAG: hypothetical protein HND44_05335 [Chloroflexi bacterium]|nr:hypothetical protein [Ardenticatenaceae bacterium]MBL1127916.1 hypothetical protein [Chloroflexota bacterium]NOG33986.1 hypothetical protein [Chloroflexota bacterium]GIK55672.1 MAG: hypothetical protein BroJett015_13350 [Chloroflexota bacterium]